MPMAATLRGLLLAILLVVAGVPASAKDYTVGDSSGWKPGVDYTAWAKGKPFSVGDTISFQYGAGHSVLEVSEADRSACSTSNPLRTHDGDSSTTVPLTKPGTRYFVCGAAGHCASGMKLAVTVSDGGATSSPSGPTMRSTNAKPAAGAAAAATESDSSAAAAASGARLATGLVLGAVGFAALVG